MSDLTPEQRCDRVRMALAEAGYPDALVFAKADPDGTEVVRIGKEVPDPVAWRSWAIAGEPELICWPCWSTSLNYRPDCDHDPLTSPWPEVVR